MAPEVWFLIIMGLVIFNYLFSNILDYLNHKNWKDEIPSELKDFYDKKKYKQAKQYAISKNKIGLLSSTTSFLLVVSLLVFNGYGYIDQLVNSFSLNLFLPFEINNSFIESGIFFLILFTLNLIISIPFSFYNTFVIEENFGFNKTSKSTFFFDIIKSSMLSILIGGFLLFLALYLFDSLNDGFWLYLWIGLSLLMVFINMFYADLIVPIFNKLTPLENGELRKKIENYSKQVGYLLKNIYVIDGSKRSTKANAFFSGLGPRKNMIVFSLILTMVTFLFIILGALLFIYANENNIAIPLVDNSARTDLLFPEIALKSGLGEFLGITFILGLIAAAYSSADSALTSLTTSFCVDILKIDSTNSKSIKTRKNTHVLMSIVLIIVVIIFRYIQDKNVIDSLLTVAQYTYGPLLGLFAFGIFTKYQIDDSKVYLVVIINIIIIVIIGNLPSELIGGYQIGYELLPFNGLLNFIGLYIIRK